MRYTPKSELDLRIQRLQAQMATAQVDGALIVQTADLFYFSGTAQQAHLFVPAEGPPLLMARKSFTRAREESALDHVVPIRSLRELPDLIRAHTSAPLHWLGMELDVIPANLYFTYQRVFEGVALTDISTAIRTVRMIKSPYEVELMRQAAQINDAIVRAVPQFLKEGMTEIALAGQLEAVARAAGHQGLVWVRNWNQELDAGVVVAGETGTIPSAFDGPLGSLGMNPAVPQGASDRPIRRGEPIVVDYITAAEGYLVDQTRTFSLGPLPDHLVAAYEAMREVQAAVQEAAKPGVLCSDLYHLAQERAAALGYAEGFMGYGEGKVRFIAHGIGLEVDEWPLLAPKFDRPLEPGMVFALEPKVWFPGEGAVGVENTWLVTEDGVTSITFSDEALGVIETEV